MAVATTQITPLVTFTLPGTPHSVQMARFYVRAALGYHDLSDYAEDAVAVTSELVTNAIQHASRDSTGTVKVTLIRARNPGAVTIVVADSSPEGPVIRATPDGSEGGRGLRIVGELAGCWGWNPEDGGKAVYAVLAEHGSAR